MDFQSEKLEALSNKVYNIPKIKSYIDNRPERPLWIVYLSAKCPKTRYLKINIDKLMLLTCKFIYTMKMNLENRVAPMPP